MSLDNLWNSVNPSPNKRNYMFKIKINRDTKEAVVEFWEHNFQVKTTLTRNILEEFVTAAKNVLDQMEPNYTESVKLQPKYEVALYKSLYRSLYERVKQDNKTIFDFCKEVGVHEELEKRLVALKED